MPRRKGIPSYTFHKSTNQARVRIDGHDHYLGEYGSEESKAEYQKLVRRHLADRTREEMKRSIQLHTDITIAEILVRYLVHVANYYRKNGEPTKQVALIKRACRILREKYGTLEACQFGPLALKQLREAYVGQGWCRREVNRAVRLVVQLFRWAVNEELLPAPTWEALRSVPGLRKGRCDAPDLPPVGPVSAEIVERTIEHLCPTLAAMVRLQLVSAMRPGELVIIRACDLNMSGPIWEYRPESQKGEHEKPRVIMLGPRAQEIIRPFLGLDLSGYLFSPKRAIAEQNAARRSQRQTPLWASHIQHQEKTRNARGRKPLHDRYDVNAYRRAIARACDRAFPHAELAAIPPKERTPDQRAELRAWQKSHRWHPHQLRHSAATFIRRQCGAEVAQAVLGHAELCTTEIYAEKDLDAARAAMARFG
jgi:integrase